ncbi:MAG: hypothetical protein EP298_11635 [Gammaproteobacteria bacterium]|nr:MAG: hypothetical protein EP298_11635 [Gammaproteobacteria bacterium]UTW42090.1 ParD-like family protein [bacterium SCSIO 12844]
MGIVKISDNLHTKVKEMASVMDRSINQQSEHWLKIGEMAEMNPELTYREIIRLLFKEKEALISD